MSDNLWKATSAKLNGLGTNRNTDGWLLFPVDRKLRQSLFFPKEVMKHPAKMNLHLQQAIIKHVAKQGDILLDPFGGTGSLMVGALYGIRVILIEVEAGYHELQVEARKNLADMYGLEGLVTLLHGDCRFILPITCNHIITSPPYASAMKIDRVRKVEEGDGLFAKYDEQMVEYSKDQRNLSKLNTFLYNMHMERIYKLCYQSLPPGGTMSVVIKDRIEQGKRIYLSKWVINVCQNLGFKLELWDKWKTAGFTYTNIARSQGKPVVDDEDVLIWKKL